ncbi:unnamed protein product [Dibothriocephalus latus]|uniref:Histone acetyltransferase type B catalytic subunit n=1 Tax=Dibothriocephalus latus TaxID=60516 RepID=A0A3P7LRK4_DIBLA|nr:unnamed protein product [Dibothriocephalus latus]
MESALQPIIEEYKVDAFDALHFKLIPIYKRPLNDLIVREKSDLEAGESFNPEMTHQIFGESEKIFGYKDLSVTIAVMAGSLSTYVDIKYSEKISPNLSKGVEPDDIVKEMSKIYDEKLITSEAGFWETFGEELSFRPFGTLKSGYTLNKGGHAHEFVIYHVDQTADNFDEFTKYHKRMEPFLMYFIDGSSFITLDENWSFYILYEKFTSHSSPEKRYALVGFLTMYAFYAFPEHVRPRVSQVLILPPFRGMGHATRLLEVVYDDFVPLPKVIDITVEEPSPDFQRLRDFLDCKRCLQLNECLQQIKSAITSSNAPATNGRSVGADGDANSCPKRRRTSAVVPAVSVNPAAPFVCVAKEKLKLCKKQAYRVYDILRLFLLPRNNPDAEAKYKNALKERTKIIYRVSLLIHPHFATNSVV